MSGYAAPSINTRETAQEKHSSKHELRQVTNQSGFVFPSLYSFPPFFTRQVHAATLAAQISSWTELILAYCRHHRLFRLEIGQGSLKHELWCNAAINRGFCRDSSLNLKKEKGAVDVAFQRELIANMVNHNQSAQYDPPLSNKQAIPTGAFIFFRRPEEWAELIYIWVAENGLTNSVMTFYELTTGGDLAPSTDFYELPTPILRQSLAHLVKQNRAQVFKGTEEDGDGVKFF